MSFNTVSTAALAPLRDGPLPRCTGPVYANMSVAAKELTRTVGVSGVNVLKDGKETASHNPHNTLVYSMTKYDDRLQAAMKGVADGATIPPVRGVPMTGRACRRAWDKSAESFHDNGAWASWNVFGLRQSVVSRWRN